MPSRWGSDRENRAADKAGRRLRHGSLPLPRHLMTAKVIEDNDVSGLQRKAQEFAHIGKTLSITEGPMPLH